MRTWELHTGDGRMYGFEISNLLITRKGVVKTIMRVPGVIVTKGTQYRDRRQDVFCHFLLDDIDFHAREPNGDSGRYTIYTDHEQGFSSVPAIKLVFDRRHLFGAT